MNETTITLSGNLVSDVDHRTTARGDAVARFRVASTATRYDRSSGRWVDGDTTYWNVTAWRRAADNARDSLAKGQPVVVHGRVRQRTVDRDVQGAPGVTVPVTYTDVEALHFGLDLTRCRATYRRAPLGPQTTEGTAPGDVGGSGEHPGGTGAVPGGAAGSGGGAGSGSAAGPDPGQAPAGGAGAPGATAEPGGSGVAA